MQGMRRGWQGSLGWNSPAQFSQQYQVLSVKAKVMTGSSVDLRPPTPLCPAHLLPLAELCQRLNDLPPTAVWLMSSPPVGCCSHLTYLRLTPDCLIKMHPPSALLWLLCPLPFSILFIFHHTYHWSYYIVTYFCLPHSVGYKCHGNRNCIFYFLIYPKPLEHCLMLN